MRYCGNLLIKAEGGAKNYKRDHPLPLAWRSFTVAFVQRKGYSLTFGTSLTFLLGLLSAVLIAVAFRYLATKPSFYFACFYFYFAVFFAPWLLPSRRYCFRCLGCRSVLRFSLPFLILDAIFIAMPFSSLPSILSLFSQQYRGFSFKAGP